MGALGDCELIRNPVFGQPVNSITSLAFAFAGIWIATKQPVRWVGLATIATGIGSFLFHGPMTAGSEWAHDVSLAWLLLVIGAVGTRWEAWSRIPGLLSLSALFGVSPALGDPIAAGLAVIVVSAIVIRRTRWSQLAPLGVVGVAALLGRLGSTEGPWCDPESLLQLHGLWHLGAAAGVAWWASNVAGERV